MAFKTTEEASSKLAQITAGWRTRGEGTAYSADHIHAQIDVSHSLSRAEAESLSTHLLTLKTSTASSRVACSDIQLG